MLDCVRDRRRSKASITSAMNNNAYTPRYVSARQRRCAAPASSVPTSATDTPQSHSCHGGSVALSSPPSAAASTIRTRVSELSATDDVDEISRPTAPKDPDEVGNNGCIGESYWDVSKTSPSPSAAL